MSTAIDPAFADRCTATAVGLRQLAALGACSDTDDGSLELAARVTAELLTDPEALLAVTLTIQQQRELGERAAFTAGYDAGWDETGEGYNGEYVSERKDQDDPGWYERARGRALEGHLKPDDGGAR